MSFPLYDEDALPAAVAVEDIDSINAMLAMERLTEANERYRIEDVDDEFESTLHGLANKTHLP